jgi:membrane peptidoglycan carboxypeptidase
VESFPGSGDATVPIDPDNWTVVTDGMAEVTEPGAFHTAGSAHLEGIDFGGKTGTAQLMSHEALGKTTKGKSTNPNVWFVGVTPRRNPELVVAVLWQNGNFSFYPARIGAQIVAAYVEKQRRIAHNLAEPAKTDVPAEMSAVWTVPNESKGSRTVSQNAPPDRLQGGNFLIDRSGQIIAAKADRATRPEASALKGQGRVPPGRRAEDAPNKSADLAAEEMRGDKRTSPQRLKPGSKVPTLGGTAKAEPFQIRADALESYPIARKSPMGAPSSRFPFGARVRNHDPIAAHAASAAPQVPQPARKPETAPITAGQ